MPPQHKRTDDVEELILQLSKRQAEVEAEDAGLFHKLERIDKLIRLVYFVGTLFVVAILWIGYVHVTLASIQKELEKRSETVKRVDEMWFMKEHGISNKEEFQRKNGYSAPNATSP
jgi:hypothetical protein